MSSPEARLVSDDMAAGMLRDAEAILAAQLPYASRERILGVYMMALLRDRSARQELAAISGGLGAKRVSRIEEVA